MEASMRADLPLVAGLCLTESGEWKPTIRRASDDDALSEPTGTIYSLALCHGEKKQLALALGLSERIPGAYERLGLIEFYDDSDEPTIYQKWFGDTANSVVRIV
jgi:hypothetical protein